MADKNDSNTSGKVSIVSGLGAAAAGVYAADKHDDAKAGKSLLPTQKDVLTAQKKRKSDTKTVYW